MSGRITSINICSSTTSARCSFWWGRSCRPAARVAGQVQRAVRQVCKGIVDLIRSYGKKSILHYHGQLYDVLDGMKQIGPDALHTIEAPPVGNCTIAQAREELGDMILIGNVQYDDLAHQSREEIAAQVRAAVAEGGGAVYPIADRRAVWRTWFQTRWWRIILRLLRQGYDMADGKKRRCGITARTCALRCCGRAAPSRKTARWRRRFSAQAVRFVPR